MFRKSYISVNLDNLKHNIDYLKEHSKKNIMAVLKADAYGMVDQIIGKELEEIGVDFFAVSSLEEAIHLRNSGINGKVLILGYVSDFELIKQYDFSIVTVSKDFVLNNLNSLKGIKIHIKVNTGMNRIGILPNEAQEVLELLVNAGAEVEGIMTHYYAALNKEDTDKQFEIFKNCVNSLKYKFKYIHASASDATIHHQDDLCNYCRVGIAMYGYGSKELKECVELKSRVIDVKKVNKGEGISYSHNYISDGEGYILTIPIGYADGFARGNTNKDVYIEGEVGEIVGNVCMDMLMIHTHKYHPVNSEVELYGEHISIEKRAAALNTITYELLTSLSERITRLYIKDNKVIYEFNERFQGIL